MANTQTLYLAGGCFWGVEELFRQIPGVVETQAGYANGNLTQDVTYQRVCEGDTEFRETVHVVFDPAIVSAERILWAYFRIVDPTVSNRQGNDVGTQYQAGIYWDAADSELREVVRQIVDGERARVEAQGLPFCIEAHELRNFFEAEEYHQRYLVKNPGGYCHVPRTEMDEVLAELT
ncbi:MAG: peptide-methionine (S)-S-oxide reductase MsrA [Atopobiaceae bacterium]|nr:peptide-methionine (S)-S-oxide reductase MsrA [Atopobiaceae bacterium]